MPIADSPMAKLRTMIEKEISEFRPMTKPKPRDYIAATLHAVLLFTKHDFVLTEGMISDIHKSIIVEDLIK